MHRNHRVIAVIPAGRQRVMSLLLQHLRAQRGLVDGVQMWINTEEPDDLEWIYAQADDFCVPVELDPAPRLVPKQLNTGRFYRNCEEDAIYIRFDDDIVWMHPEAIRNLVDFRLDNPDPFVVFALIWNNAIVSHLEQQRGILDNRHGRTKLAAVDEVGWQNAEFGVYVHRVLLEHIDEGTTDRLFLPDPFQLRGSDHKGRGVPIRFSVSCFAFNGMDFVDPVGAEEENWISRTYPGLSERWNMVCPNALVAHYSFFTQRHKLDQTDILERYRVLATDARHDAYYSNLNEFPVYEHTEWWRTHALT